MKRAYDFSGGRKQFLGFLGYATAVALGLIMHASYEAVMAAVLLTLGITQATVAWDDRASKGKLGGS